MQLHIDVNDYLIWERMVLWNCCVICGSCGFSRFSFVLLQNHIPLMFVELYQKQKRSYGIDCFGSYLTRIIRLNQSLPMLIARLFVVWCNIPVNKTCTVNGLFPDGTKPSPNQNWLVVSQVQWQWFEGDCAKSVTYSLIDFMNFIVKYMH